MNGTTFEWNKAIFSLQEDTVKSGIIADFVLYLLFPEPSDLEYRYGLDYGNFLARVTLVSGDPGFTIPSLDGSAEGIKSFYALYSGLPRQFRNSYLRAAASLLIAPNAPDLTPGVDPKEPGASSTDGSGSTNSEKQTATLLALHGPD